MMCPLVIALPEVVAPAAVLPVVGVASAVAELFGLAATLAAGSNQTPGTDKL